MWDTRTLSFEDENRLMVLHALREMFAMAVARFEGVERVLQVVVLLLLDVYCFAGLQMTVADYSLSCGYVRLVVHQQL